MAAAIADRLRSTEDTAALIGAAKPQPGEGAPCTKRGAAAEPENAE